MKGSLFPLGQPLGLEDQPGAGFLPRLRPCLPPAAVGVALVPGSCPRPAPPSRGSLCAGICPPWCAVPPADPQSPVWPQGRAEPEWGAPCWGGPGSALHTHVNLRGLRKASLGGKAGASSRGKEISGGQGVTGRRPLQRLEPQETPPTLQTRAEREAQSGEQVGPGHAAPAGLPVPGWTAPPASPLTSRASVPLDTRSPLLASCQLPPAPAPPPTYPALSSCPRDLSKAQP